MSLSRPSEELEALYKYISRTAREAHTNVVRVDLPVRLEMPGEYRFLPATSLAIQSLIPPSTQVHAAFLDVVSIYRAQFPQVEAKVFWQPERTFHLNVAILRRLSVALVPLDEYRQIVDAASPVLDWVDGQPSYDIQFRGVLIAPDGTLMAKGYALSETPWSIRQKFAEHGFVDQQKMLHVTLGRILEVLPPKTWQKLINFTEEHLSSQYLGTLHVQKAVLLSEWEGFLHTPSSYEVIRQYHFREEA